MPKIYEVGTKFYKQYGRITQLHTVVDVLTTTNLAGQVVKLRYATTHRVAGQDILDSDICAVTIAKGLIQ